MIAQVVTVRIKPETRQRFLEVIEYDAIHSEADEPGCVRFNVLQDTKDPNVYIFYEVYKDDGALAAHRDTPHFAMWSEAAKECLDGLAQRTLCSAIFPADSAYWDK